jgi:hypothetical protein
MRKRIVAGILAALGTTLLRPGLRVLVVAGAEWYSDGVAGPATAQLTDGGCRIGVNGAPSAPTSSRARHRTSAVDRLALADARERDRP